MPPPNGTTGSAEPCTSSTETGRDGAHGNAVPNVPATGAMAETTSARSHPCGEYPAAVYAIVVGESIDERNEEADVVDSLTIGD